MKSSQQTMFEAEVKVIEEKFSILDMIATVQALSFEDINNIDGIGNKIGEMKKRERTQKYGESINGTFDNINSSMPCI